MFGINFNVSIGRCIRGAFVQLLSFDENAKKISKCDHLLLIDTEGLRAPELEQLVREEHDNELATFVIGLADAAIITVHGEVQGDLANILLTVTHALIRMDKIDINPSCKFVHQQMSGSGVIVNTSEGKKKFLSELDENIQRACELEHIKGKYKSFSTFMNFNEDTDVLYFDSLWDGIPPMARVNIRYTESAQNLKTSLIECKGGCSRQSTFREFSVKIDRLWNAVLREQFLFSFRNTLEVMYHKEFNQKHSEWKAVFQRNLLQWKDKVEFKFKNVTAQAVNGTKINLLNQIRQILNKAQKEVVVERDNYIIGSKYPQILEKWLTDSNDDVNKYREDYWTQAMDYVEQLASARIIEIKIDEIIGTIESKLEDLANCLVIGNNQRLSDDILKKNFDKLWSTWLGGIPSITFKTSGDVEDEILKILRELKPFAIHKELLNYKLSQMPFRKWQKVLSVDCKHHLEYKKSQSRFSGMKTIANAETKCSQLVHMVTKNMGLKLDSLPSSKRPFHFEIMLEEFSKQIKNLLEMVIHMNEDINQTFYFKTEFIVDIALTASKCAEEILLDTVEQSKKGDAKCVLEKEKDKFYRKLHFFYTTQKDTQEKEIRRQKEEAERQQEEIRRQKEEAERQQEEIRRQKEEAKRQKEETRRQQEENRRQKEEIE